MFDFGGELMIQILRRFFFCKKVLKQTKKNVII